MADMGQEQLALQGVWKDIWVSFCTFHIAQAVVRWLKDKDHGIKEDDHVGLYQAFRDLLYSSPASKKVQTEDGKEVDEVEDALEGLQRAVSEFRKQEAVRRNPQFVAYLERDYALRLECPQDYQKIYTCFRAGNLDRYT